MLQKLQKPVKRPTLDTSILLTFLSFFMCFKDDFYKVAFSLIPRVGARLGKQLLSYCGSPEAVFNTPPGKLQKIPGMGPSTSRAIRDSSVMKQAEIICRAAERNHTQILFFTDQAYPGRLKEVYDAPLVLFRKGDADLNTQKVISVVGTRYATEYGKEMVESLIKGFKDHNPLIVSGLAYGIDVVAHKTALIEGLETVAVFGCGLDRVYPAVHGAVVREMLKNKGGIISEYSFGTLPEVHHFPSRNRIIAGLSDAVIVVEAAKKGGALITADIAESYYRDVFAVPGNAGRVWSEGCNNLIKYQKAQMLTHASDLDYFMKWGNFSHENDYKKQKEDLIKEKKLNEEEQRVMDKLMGAETMLLDELSWKMGLSVGRLSSVMLQLEMHGLVKSLPGKRYRSKI